MFMLKSLAGVCRSETFIRPDDDLINLCVRCEAHQYAHLLSGLVAVR